MNRSVTPNAPQELAGPLQDPPGVPDPGDWRSSQADGVLVVLACALIVGDEIVMGVTAFLLDHSGWTDDKA